jgi:hypothetical protein
MVRSETTPILIDQMLPQKLDAVAAVRTPPVRRGYQARAPQ